MKVSNNFDNSEQQTWCLGGLGQVALPWSTSHVALKWFNEHKPIDLYHQHNSHIFTIMHVFKCYFKCIQWIKHVYQCGNILINLPCPGRNLNLFWVYDELGPTKFVTFMKVATMLDDEVIQVSLYNFDKLKNIREAWDVWIKPPCLESMTISSAIHNMKRGQRMFNIHKFSICVTTVFLCISNTFKSVIDIWQLWCCGRQLRHQLCIDLAPWSTPTVLYVCVRISTYVL